MSVAYQAIERGDANIPEEKTRTTYPPKGSPVEGSMSWAGSPIRSHEREAR